MLYVVLNSRMRIEHRMIIDTWFYSYTKVVALYIEDPMTMRIFQCLDCWIIGKKHLTFLRTFQFGRDEILIPRGLGLVTTRFPILQPGVAVNGGFLPKRLSDFL